MKSLHFLYAAYSATWIIHLSYIGILLRMSAHLRKEFKEFERADLKKK